jgi:BlaI family transcriptional regulator, penicillinase repressor
MRIAFTDRELDVMTVLWDLGSATVAEVRERLEDSLAYTTVLSVLRTLEEKGYADHRGEGKAHRYHPLVERQAAGRSAVSRLLATVFRGAPEMLLAQLVGDRDLSAAELERLRKAMDDRIREDQDRAAATKRRAATPRSRK